MSLLTITIVLLTIALFVLGVVVGWVYSNGANTTKQRKAKIKTIVSLAVTFVWITATIADIVLTGYTISPMVHAIMGAVVGYFFTDDGIVFNVGGSDDE